MDDPCQFLLYGAHAHNLRDLLAPDADHVLLFDHIPSPAWTWWTAEVPLARNGKNRRVSLRDLSFDLQVTTEDFMGWLDDFEAGGLALVQSDRMLPANFHPARFRTESSYLKVLADFGARLEFQLSHANETAGVTLFQQSDVDRIMEKGVALVEDPYVHERKRSYWNQT